jgi:DNA-directed RNA polymerase II subunit RPB2
MTNNFTYVFKKKQPSKFTWIAEIRSFLEGVSDKPTQFSIRLFNKIQRNDKSTV